MKIKRIFNVKLFLDALKQLRLVGIITFIITLCGSLLFPFAAYSQMKSNAMNISSNASMIPYFVNIDQAAPLLFVFMLLAPLIFVLYLFRFQNKRNSSDFFHSIPESRITIYTSYTAAVLAWLYATIIAVLGIVSLIYIVFVGGFNLYYIPYLLFTFLVSTTLVAGAALVAVSITGTILTNITLTTLVLFLPRLITFMMTYCIMHLLPNMTIDNFGMFTNINYNIPLKFLVYISPLNFIGNTGLIGGTDKYTFMPAYFYTFAVAVILIALAGFFFVKRKSETAQKSAPDRLLQHVYRCAVTLPFTLLITGVILSYQNILNSGDSGGILIIIFLIFASLFVYFLYELITTKKLINLLKAAPVFLVLVLINAIFCLWIYGVKAADLSFNPTADEISSVLIFHSDRYSAYNDASQIKLTDPNLIKFISQTLKDSNDSASTNKSKNNTEDQGYSTFQLNLKNGKSVVRFLQYDQKNYQSVVAKALNKSAEYGKALYALPNDKDISYIALSNLKQDVIQKIWSSYKQEYISLSNNEKNQIFLRELPLFESLNITTSIGIENRFYSYSLTPLTPITSQWAMEEQNNASKDEMVKDINKILNLDKFTHNIQIVFEGNNLPAIFKNYNFNTDYQCYSDGTSRGFKYTLQTENQFVSLIAKNISLKPDITKPFAEITLSTNNTGRQYQYYIALDNDTINQLAALIPTLKTVNNNNN